MPGYVSAFAIAAKLGLPVTQLDDVDPFWMAAAEVMLRAEQLTREDEEKQRSAKRA